MDDALPPDAVIAVPLPAASRVTGFYPHTDLADAFAVHLPPDATPDLERLARHIFDGQARWVGRLLALRDKIVAPFGIRSTTQLASAQAATSVRRISFFRIYAQDADEILIGEDDSHLNFRIAMRRDVTAQRLTLATVVHCNNRIGRLYIALIAPFHRLVVRSALQHAARHGWPRD